MAEVWSGQDCQGGDRASLDRLVFISNGVRNKEHNPTSPLLIVAGLRTNRTGVPLYSGAPVPGTQGLTEQERPAIGRQHFVPESSQGDSAAFPPFLDTYATHPLPEPLS
jgi:hypothetical protein